MPKIKARPNLFVMDPLQAKYVTEVFYTLVTKTVPKTENRLQNGIERRKQMVEQLKKGQQPTGVRAEWLKDSARRVLETLSQIAEDFNAANPDDRASVYDFIDILATVSAWLKKNA